MKNLTHVHVKKVKLYSLFIYYYYLFLINKKLQRC